jgi:transposase
MPVRAEVVLDDEERETLERWARRPKSSQALAFRCRIVLAAAEGRSSKEIAAELGCNANTVGKWRGRFARRGFDGLHDEPRPGKPRSISDEDVERVIVKTLEEQPANATHWSTRSMAAATGMSQTAVSRIWRAFGLKPHQTEAFKLSPDPQFIDKVRDVVGLYLNPPEAAWSKCRYVLTTTSTPARSKACSLSGTRRGSRSAAAGCSSVMPVSTRTRASGWSMRWT